jgi:predicted HTH domain antitoxin
MFETELSQAERIKRACELYASGKLSRGPAAKFAGLDRAQFDAELFRRRIQSYTPDMLEQDLAVVAEEPPQ